MKFQHLGVAVLGAAATVSAGSLMERSQVSQCPSGYSMSVYYITSTIAAEPTASSTSTSSVQAMAVQPTTVQETTSQPTTESTTVQLTAVPSTTTEYVYSTSTSTIYETVSGSCCTSASVGTTPCLSSVQSRTTTLYSTSTTTIYETVHGQSSAGPTTAVTSLPAITLTTVISKTPASTAAPISTSASCEEPEPVQTTVSPVESYSAPTISTSVSENSEPPVSFTEPQTTSVAAPPAPSETASTTTSEATTPAPSSSTPGTSLGGRSYSGEATFYGGNTAGGTCSFTGYTVPAGLFGTALTSSSWDDAAHCGACISVTGPSGNSIKAMIVDQCPDCGTNHLDLYPDAFAQLANPTKGVVNIDWSFIPCEINSPIILKNKEGTSRYWFSMQVVNANVPVASLEVSTDGGNTWRSTTRKYYNYFENQSGFGTDTVDVRVTSVLGGTVTVKDVSVDSGVSVTASKNF